MTKICYNSLMQIDVTRILYHGSKSGIVGPIAPISRDVCDFGRGFYLGDSPTQPMTLICHDASPKFYVCELDLSGLGTYVFSDKNQWALYIAYCRGKCRRFSGTVLYRQLEDLAAGQDVLVGKIANDRMFMVLNDFFDGAITDKAMVASLEVLNLGTQYCLKTAKACSRVRIREERSVSVSECAALRTKSDDQRRRAIELTEGVYKQYRRDGLFFDEFFEEYATKGLPCS